MGLLQAQLEAREASSREMDEIMGGGAMILLFHGRGAISALIRWQTRGNYSHAALMDASDGSIIEAWQGAGVRRRRLEDWSGVDAFNVQGMTPEMWAEACAWAASHIGDRYDYRSVFRFMTRKDCSPDDVWFCSEIVFAALEHVGIRLLRTDAWRVSPEMLSMSPLLIQA